MLIWKCANLEIRCTAMCWACRSKLAYTEFIEVSKSHHAKSWFSTRRERDF